MINRNTSLESLLGIGAFLAVSVLSSVDVWAVECTQTDWDDKDLEEKVECLDEKLANVSIDYDENDNPVVTITGANISIESESDIDGTGNLIVGSYHTWIDSTGGFVSGYNNTIEGSWNTANGGYGNISGGTQSVIDGGAANIARDLQSTVIGGSHNRTDGEQTTVCGGLRNSAEDTYATVSGGESNTAVGQASVASGGARNVASGELVYTMDGQKNAAAVAAGGSDNRASGQSAAVLGGSDNEAAGLYATVISGYGNIAGGDRATILGGGGNEVTAEGSVVAGGHSNSCNAGISTIVAGYGNEVMACEGGGYFSISGGFENVAQKYGCSASWQTISGGKQIEMLSTMGWCAGHECYESGFNANPDVLNRGSGLGYLRLYVGGGEIPDVTVRDIVVIDKIPNDMSHVGGIISTVPQTPLSHINLKAIQNNTPNMYIEDIMEMEGIEELEGKLVYFRVSDYDFELRAADNEEILGFEDYLNDLRPQDISYPPRNMDVKEVKPLDAIWFFDRETGFKNSEAFGAKATNVAELLKIEDLRDGMVPNGFAVPFYFYHTFMDKPRSDFYEEFEKYYYCNFDIDALDIDENVNLDQVEVYSDDQPIPHDPGCTGGTGWKLAVNKYNNKIRYDEIELCPDTCAELMSAVVVTSVTAKYAGKELDKPRSPFYEEFIRKLIAEPSKEYSFYDYARLMIDDDDELMTADEQFRNDPEIRAKDLWAFRKLIEGIPGDPTADLPIGMVYEFDKIYDHFDEDSHLRCRSSSNNEDLDDFNGAGLYDSKTHKPKKEGHISKTIREIWASLWTFRAFEERWFYRVDHLTAAMGVLIHPNYKDEEVNGVGVTKNIFYPNAFGDGYYINAQRGEDQVTNPPPNSEPEAWVIEKRKDSPDYWAEKVGESNMYAPGEDLLNPTFIGELTEAMTIIHDHFAALYQRSNPYFDSENFAMDLEFKITGGWDRLAIKQARPWVDPEY